MTDADAQWKVLPHDPLTQLDDELWRMEGALPRGSLRRVMTVARQPDGGLVIHNGIAMSDDERAKLEALGRPAVLLVPNGFHRLDAAAYVARYPWLRVVCPRGARDAVRKVVRVDGVYGETDLGAGLTLEPVDGTREREGVLVAKSAKGRTVVFNDLIFNMPHGVGLEGFVLRYLTRSTGGPRTTVVSRLALLADKPAARAHLERLATDDLQRIVVSHHEVIASEPAATLRAIAATL